MEVEVKSPMGNYMFQQNPMFLFGIKTEQNDLVTLFGGKRFGIEATRFLEARSFEGGFKFTDSTGTRGRFPWYPRQVHVGTFTNRNRNE